MNIDANFGTVLLPFSRQVNPVSELLRSLRGEKRREFEILASCIPSLVNE
jgi:hypothetical protein